MSQTWNKWTQYSIFHFVSIFLSVEQTQESSWFLNRERSIFQIPETAKKHRLRRLKAKQQQWTDVFVAADGQAYPFTSINDKSEHIDA